MAKHQLGLFKNKEGKVYNIYFRQSCFGYRNSGIEVGNHTYGIFFRFNPENEFVYLRGENGFAEISFQKSDDDIVQLLSMVFPLRKLELVILHKKSRQELGDIILVEEI